MNTVQSNETIRASLPAQNRFHRTRAIWWLSILSLGLAALLLAGCGGDSSSTSTTSGGGGGTWGGPAYSAFLGSVTVDGSGCLAFPSGIAVISFDAGFAATTARVTVSGSLDAANSYMMIFAYGNAADTIGSYKTSFAMDGFVFPGENDLVLWTAVGAPAGANAPSTGGFTPFATGESFTSWVSDFDSVAESADSWWPDTTPGAVGTGDVTSTGGMGTSGGSAAFVSGVSATLCSYEVS